MNTMQGSLLLVGREEMDTEGSWVFLLMEYLNQTSHALDETPRLAPDAKPISKFHFF